MLPTLIIIIVVVLAPVPGRIIPRIFNIELQNVGKNNHFAQQIISNDIAGDPVKEKKTKDRTTKFKSKKHKAGEKENATNGTKEEKGEDYQWDTVVSVLTSEAAKKAAVAAAKEVCKAALGAENSDDPDEKKEGKKEGKKGGKKAKKKKKKEEKEPPYTEQAKKTLKRMKTELVGWKKWATTHLKGLSKVAKKATISAARAACKSIGN